MYVKKCVHKYVKSYNGQTKWICFSIEDDGLWKNVLIFGIKSVVILKKAKDFHNNKISKVASHPTCLAVIMVDPVFKNDENYYQEVFFKEFKYNEKK